MSEMSASLGQKWLLLGHKWLMRPVAFRLKLWPLTVYIFKSPQYSSHRYRNAPSNTVSLVAWRMCTMPIGITTRPPEGFGSGVIRTLSSGAFPSQQDHHWSR